MAGKLRPSLRAKTLSNVMASNLSESDKQCIQRVFEQYESLHQGDIVPVVRCKDCEYRGIPGVCPMCFEEEVEWDDDGYTECEWINYDNTDDDEFCSCGKRKE